MNKRITLAFLASATLLGLTACSPSVHAEYTVYSSADALAEASTDVVQVTIVSARNDTLESKPFTGTDPETNPYYGTDGKQPSSDQTSVDVVIFEGTVNEAYKGPEKSGSTIEISQLRNEADGVSLKEGETYVLYLRNADPSYPAGIVGGSQGQYLYVDGELTPANPEIGFELSAEQLRSLE